MKIETRLILSYVIRLVLLGFAGWFALAEPALPGAHVVTRIALAAAFLVLSILVGEIAGVGIQQEMLLRAIRAAGAQTGEGATPRKRDDREAVRILLRALDSKNEAAREAAWKNLKRITGQDLPPDREQWEAWWREHADTVLKD